jgi:hypothetical protein
MDACWDLENINSTSVSSRLIPLKNASFSSLVSILNSELIGWRWYVGIWETLILTSVSTHTSSRLISLIMLRFPR